MKKIIVGMATFPGREEVVKLAMDSLRPQCDEIFLYDNGKEPFDITDLGKFQGLHRIKEPCFYLSCDDDLLYPPTYCQDMVEAIKRTGSIVSHHGRILAGLDLNYYFGHLSYRCLGKIDKERFIDVAGTGVTGWDTEYFNPLNLIYSKDMKMSDLVFSLEAAKQKKHITILTHEKGYINHLPIDMSKTICATEQRNCDRQGQLANEILKLNSRK